MMIRYFIGGLFLGPLLFAGCATSEQVLNVPVSQLSSGTAPVAIDEATPDTGSDPDQANDQAGMERLSPLAAAGPRVQQDDLSTRFRDDDELRVAVEDMPLQQFLHYAFGELLGVNYVISDGLDNLDAPVTLNRSRFQPGNQQFNNGSMQARPVAANPRPAASSDPPDLDAPVTVNLQDPVSSRRLFTLATELLAERNVRVTYRDGVYYLLPINGRGNGNVFIGFGSRAEDVPDVPEQVMQIIPLRYGLSPSIERTIRGLVNADVVGDVQQGALFVTGERAEILRVLDVVNLMDQPAQRGRNIGLVTLTYIAVEEYMDRIVELLSVEGVPVGIGPGMSSGSVALVHLPSLGGVAVFAATRPLLDRVDYWTRKLDQPAQGSERSYYIYTPRYARADELGQSLVPLLGDGQSAGTSSESAARDTRSALGGGAMTQSVVDSALSNRRDDYGSRSAGAARAPVSVHAEDLTMAVDLRSNALIFNTTGTRYQALLPMIRRLDTPPRQILLEATIAEVQLTDEFALGVEFAFSSGEVSLGTTGGLGLPEGGGFISIVGSDGAIKAQLSATNKLVNVLSNPTLVVRDGVSANISVGNDIPTVGATFFDPIQSETQITTVQYRKTGVNLTVRPTLNAQGLVVMEIQQEISNTVEGGSDVSGTPAIFERSLSTEVVARSGETVLLGGLISEITNDTVSKVPGLGDIPWLGRLFRSDTQSTERTELVVMITPRVLDESTKWDEVLNSMDNALRYLTLEQPDDNPPERGESATK
jgi:general secretion pathway protein D